jgi:hypothetical protein
MNLVSSTLKKWVVPKFRQGCKPKCRPIPKEFKTADTDTETDNFRSLIASTITLRKLILKLKN